MADIVQELRSEADDIEKWDGEAMTTWDEIRSQVETHKGSDLPRLNFESLICEYADLMRRAADEIVRLRG